MQESQHSEVTKPSSTNVGVRLAAAEMRADVAEKYCTKEDAREIKKDVDTRIDDIRGTIWHIVIPLIIALLGLIGVIVWLGISVARSAG